MDSTFHYDASNYPHPLGAIPVTDFFGSVSAIQETPPLRVTAGELARDPADPPPAAAAPAQQSTAEAGAGAARATGQPVAAIAANKRVSSVLQHPIGQKASPVVGRRASGSKYGSAAVPGSVYWGMLGLLAAVAAAALLQPQLADCHSSSSKAGKAL